MVHFLYHYTRINDIYIIQRKLFSLEIIQEFVTFVNRRYNCLVQIIRFDEETSLENNFDACITQEDIIVEQSSPYTPTQNGSAERSRGVIITKTRTIRIGARLPKKLWPEAAKTTGCFINRSSSR